MEEPDRLSRRVAIAEDDTTLLDMFSFVLRKFYTISYTAITGELLLEWLSRAPTLDYPDSFILDYNLGKGKNGIEIGNIIRKLLPHARIIICTADATVESQAVSYGFLFLAKPFSVNQLRRKLAD